MSLKFQGASKYRHSCHCLVVGLEMETWRWLLLPWGECGLGGKCCPHLPGSRRERTRGLSGLTTASVVEARERACAVDRWIWEQCEANRLRKALLGGE